MLQVKNAGCVVLVLVLSVLGSGTAVAQSPKPGVKGYEVEWVYRVRYGFIDEWWDIFRKYQIPILEREKSLGYVLDYRIYHPQFHTDEAARWDYRVEITYRDVDGSRHEEEITERPVSGRGDSQARREPSVGADGQPLGPSHLSGRYNQAAVRSPEATDVHPERSGGGHNPLPSARIP